MRKSLSLLVFPIAGVLLLSLAVLWSARELRLVLTGERAAGSIVGMVLERADGVDLVSGIDTVVVLQQADGQRFEWASRDGAVLRGSPQGQDELERIAQDALTGNADILRRLLLRESRKGDDPARVVRIERTDKVAGYWGLDQLPAKLEVVDGRPVSVGRPSEVVTVRTVFDGRDEAKVESEKGETLVEFEQTRDGVPVTPKRRDFLLAAEPYTTQFRPVFVYPANGETHVGVSHIGRHGGPTLALRLHNPCRVFFDPQNPAEAVLMADAGPLDGDFLAWFSRWCEGLFSQWGSTALIVIAGLACLLVGLVLVSFSIHRHQPKPVSTPHSTKHL